MRQNIQIWNWSICEGNAMEAMFQPRGGIQTHLGWMLQTFIWISKIQKYNKHSLALMLSWIFFNADKNIHLIYLIFDIFNLIFHISYITLDILFFIFDTLHLWPGMLIWYDKRFVPMSHERFLLSSAHFHLRILNPIKKLHQQNKMLLHKSIDMLEI